jgi:hypothetical protein
MNTQDQPRRPTRSLLLPLLFILALLMSLCFTLLFVQLAWSGEKQEWLKASMATKLRADYRPDDWVKTPRFAPLRIEEVINETAEEVGEDENSSLTPLVPVEPQADSPQFVPVYEWPSD